MNHPFNLDTFSSANVAEAASMAMRVVDATQRGNPSPEIQAHGIAAAFILLAERFGLQPQEMFAKTTNLMHYAEGRRPEFAAVEAYLQGEL